MTSIKKHIPAQTVIRWNTPNGIFTGTVIEPYGEAAFSVDRTDPPGAYGVIVQRDWIIDPATKRISFTNQHGVKMSFTAEELLDKVDEAREFLASLGYRSGGDIVDGLTVVREYFLSLMLKGIGK